ncbi:hypothetical protein K4F52_002064 [Lecanicillium sp. MT-2017a]|nr:hypothetical protein K4F52_002064 [Lecanicillium sp. MT-2017a]
MKQPKHTPSRNIARYETTAVYTHPYAKVDIVLVHGLNGSPEGTWTSPDGTFWPADLLPASLRGLQANVLVYGYNADVYSRRNDRSASDNFIHQHAQTLVTSLTLYRRSEGTYKNPIIWVCHSLGGILVKRALLYSNDLRTAHHEHYRSIYVSTYGLMFLGTPHTGSDAATWGLVLQGMSDVIVPKKFFESESILLKTLKKDNEMLANINNHFLDIYQRFRIHMVHENHKTDIKGTKIIVVDANSASPQLPGVTYYGVEATHSQMCKFDNANAPGFRALTTDMRQWILDAPALIAGRWAVEEDELSARVRHEIHERISPFVISHQQQYHHQQQQHCITAATLEPSPSQLSPPHQHSYHHHHHNSQLHLAGLPSQPSSSSLHSGQNFIASSSGSPPRRGSDMSITVPRSLFGGATGGAPEGVFVLEDVEDGGGPMYRLRRSI